MIRAVLQTGVTRDDIDDAAMRCGWQLTNLVAGGAQQPAQMIYAARHGQTPLYLVEDGRLDVLYFASSGDGSGDVMAQVKRELSCCEPDAYRELLGDQADLLKLRRGLGLLVLLVTEPDEEAIGMFERALRHDDVQARTLALTAASYAPWPTLRASIEHVAANDGFPALRAGANQLLQSLFRS